MAALWLHRLLEDFGEKYRCQNTIIYEDNQSLKLICNNKFSNRTVHIDTKFHYTKDMQNQEIINYEYCSTDQMVADILTEPLGKVKLKYFVKRCGLLTVLN